MKQTRGKKQRDKMPRVMKKAMVIGVVTLLLGGVALFVTTPASTEDVAGRDGARLTDRTRVCMLQDTVQAQAGLEYNRSQA